MRYFIIIFLFSFLFNLEALSQPAAKAYQIENLKRELKEIALKMNKPDTISMMFNLVIKDDNDVNTDFANSKILLERKGAVIVNKTENNIIFRNDTLQVVVDTSDSTILLAGVEIGSHSWMDQFISGIKASEFDSIVEIENTDTAMVIIHPAEKVLPTTIITYNKLSKVLYSLELYELSRFKTNWLSKCNDSNLLIKLSLQQRSSIITLSDKYFDLDQYVRKNRESGLVAGPSFNGYTVYNAKL